MTDAISVAEATAFLRKRFPKADSFPLLLVDFTREAMSAGWYKGVQAPYHIQNQILAFPINRRV